MSRFIIIMDLFNDYLNHLTFIALIKVHDEIISQHFIQSLIQQFIKILMMMLRFKTIINNSCMLALNRKLFCSTKSPPTPNPPEVLEHKAYLASKIILQIAQIDLRKIYKDERKLNQDQKEQMIKKITSKSLSVKLLEMIDKEHKEKKLNDEAVKHMKSFFTTGVQFNPTIFNQQRITTAQKQAIIGEDNPKFRFFPMHSVTGIVFNLITKNYLNTCLFTGHYGISKSISFMLYSMLSGIIAEYKYKNYGKTTPLKKQIKNFPKLIYYSYRKSTQYPFNFNLHMKDIILMQCKEEIPEEDRNKFFVQGEGKKLLKKHYIQKDIKLILMVDQINKFIAQLRQLNILLKKIRSKIKSQSNKNLTQEQISNIQTTKVNFVKAIGTIYEEIGPIHFLSSLNVEKIITQLNQLADQDNHKRILKLSIKYIDMMIEEITICQIVDCFLFLIEEKYQINLQSLLKKQAKKQTHNSHALDQFQRLRKILINQLKQRIGTYVLTFNSMTEALDDLSNVYRQSLEYLIQNQDLENFQNQALKLLNSVISNSNLQMKQKVQYFFHKQKQISAFDSHLIKARLFFAACSAIEKDSKGSLQKFEINLNLQTNQVKLDLSRIEESIDRQLFQKEQEKMYSLIPAKFIVEILSPTMEDTFNFLAANNMLRFVYYLDSSGFGKFMEIVLIKMVQQDRINIQILPLIGQYKLKDINNKRQYLTFNEIAKYSIKRIQKIQKQAKKQQTEQIKQITKRSQKIQLRRQHKDLQKHQFKNSFVSFIKNKLQNLKDVYDKQLIPEHAYIFVPKAQNDNHKPHKIDYDQNNKSYLEIDKENDNKSKFIDFILLKINLATFAVHFHVFDVTLSSTQTFQKIQNFVEEFCCFSDLNQRFITLGQHKFETKLNYYILSPYQYSGELSKQLNSDFGKYINFIPLPGKKDACQVQNSSTDANKQFFLDKIAVLKIGRDFTVTQFLTPKQEIKEGSYHMWKEIQRRLKAGPIPSSNQ